MGGHGESAARADGAEDRMLLAIADHLHDHCTCDRIGDAVCDACEVRAGLREIRDELLAWRAQGRRLAQRREDALGNARAQVQRRRTHCDECAGLAGLAATQRGTKRDAATKDGTR